MYQVLYRKWRSQTFDEVYGQPHVTAALKNELKTGRLAHAYLFTGSRGTDTRGPDGRFSARF